MSEQNSYCRGFRFDKLIRFATDNTSGYIPIGDFNPVPPPIADFFQLLDGTHFLLLDSTAFLLLG